jgi:hypothetical protein
MNLVSIPFRPAIASPTLPACSVELADIDPPFNIGLDYPGYDGRSPEGEYFAWLEEAWSLLQVQ